MSSALTITEIAAVVATAAGVNSLTGGSITDALGFGNDDVGGGSGTGAQNAADPFSPYRAKLGALYSGALTSGQTDLTQMPGYTQFQTGVMDPALEASKRSAAASGMLRSGNEQIALEKTAEKGYYGFMTDYLNRLAQGSGAVNNPAQAAALGINQGNMNDAAVMQGLGSITSGMASLSKSFNSPTTNPGYTVDTTGYGMGSYGSSGGVDTADYGGASGPSIR
jgi:hypothetical protein